MKLLTCAVIAIGIFALFVAPQIDRWAFSWPLSVAATATILAASMVCAAIERVIRNRRRTE